MISYFKKHLFAKIGLFFFIAALCIVWFSYYISLYWVNLQKDDLIDAHEAYFQYKLIESWGNNPDTSLVAKELDNLHIQGVVYYMDGDTICENDSNLLWTNMHPPLSSCDYWSHLDTDMLGKKYDIAYEQWVSFGEVNVLGRLLQTTYIEYPPYKYYLVSGYVEPWDVFTLLPPLFLVFFLMGFLFFVIRRFLLPLSLIEKRIVELEEGDLSSTIPVVGSDELAVLTKNFNKLIFDIKQLLRQKERLLSDVSHELRSPLAKIKLALALLPKHNKADKIDKQITNLDSMITNILLSDKMASAYSNLKKEKCSVGLLIKKALDLTSVKNIIIKEKEVLDIKVDVVKASIAIKNLIENANKFSSEKDSVVVVVEKQKNMAVVSVIDSGPGIPQEELQNIKKAFVRLPGQKESGFGLGLSICNKVMIAHGGKLSIKNNTGAGACFSLSFPL